MNNCANPTCTNTLNPNRGSKYCSDYCRNAVSNNKKKKLMGLGALHANNASNLNPNASYASNMIQTNTPQTNNHMNTQEGFLLREKIQELKAEIVELKADKKEQLKEAKELTVKHNDLLVAHNTIKGQHAQDLSGVELNKRSLVTEIMDVVKNKEALDGISNIIQSFKGGTSPALPGETESEELQAVKHFFNGLSPSHQTLLGENIYAYSQRADLLLKHNQELKNTINKI
jgi:hypothetical protein